MIAHAVWSRGLPEVNDRYRLDSRDVNRHGNVKETLKTQFFLDVSLLVSSLVNCKY